MKTIILLIGFWALNGQSEVIRNPKAQTLLESMQEPLITSKCYMSGGFCGTTAPGMAMAQQGVDVDPEVLKNLGWNYGWHYAEAEGTPIISFPTTFPTEQIEHIGQTFGMKVDVQRFPHDPMNPQSVEAARQQAEGAMRAANDRGLPTIVNWRTHVVTQYGFDEQGRALYHDPSDETLPPFVDSQDHEFGIGRGPTQAESTREWSNPTRAWDSMGFPVYTMERTEDTGKTEIDWPSVWARTAYRTLGTEGQGGNDPLLPSTATGETQESFGTVGMRKFSKVLPQVFAERTEQFAMWGHLGFTARNSSADFLKKQADEARAAGKPWLADRLEKASNGFRISANFFKAAEELSGTAFAPGADKQKIGMELASIMTQIADVEYAAGKALEEASEIEKTKTTQTDEDETKRPLEEGKSPIDKASNADTGEGGENNKGSETQQESSSDDKSEDTHHKSRG